MLSQTFASMSGNFDFIVEMRVSRCLWLSLSLIFALYCRKARQAVSNPELIRMTARRLRWGIADPRRSAAPTRGSVIPRSQGLMVSAAIVPNKLARRRPRRNPWWHIHVVLPLITVSGRIRLEVDRPSSRHDRFGPG